MGLLTPTVVKTSWSLLTSLKLAVSISCSYLQFGYICPGLAARGEAPPEKKGGALMATMVGELAMVGRT